MLSILLTPTHQHNMQPMTQSPLCLHPLPSATEHISPSSAPQHLIISPPIYPSFILLLFLKSNLSSVALPHHSPALFPPPPLPQSLLFSSTSIASN